MDKKVALITGSSRGIGKHIALALASAGYDIAINYVSRKKEADDTAKEIENLGRSCIVLRADVSKQEDAKAMVVNVIEKFGRLDVLINNAGITRDRTIMKMSFDEWDSVIRTNLYGTFFVSQECFKHMANQKDGLVINISSISALRGSFGASNYAASKAAVIAFTKASAREMGRFNVRVNAVLPGFHFTDMGKKATEKYMKKVTEDNVLGTTTDVGDLTNMVLFLVRSKTVSGQVFCCDARIL